MNAVGTECVTPGLLRMNIVMNFIFVYFMDVCKLWQITHKLSKAQMALCKDYE